MNNKEKMISELPYKAWLDGLEEERFTCKEKLYKYNNLNPRKKEKLKKIILSILGECGDNFVIEPPFRCDYGKNIRIGNNFYSNYNCTILDCAPVTIGDNVLFGPNVSIFTAGHPVHPEIRNEGYEYAIKINIGNNVWIGGNTVVNPGVTIGDNVVIGSGSVVTKDIPSNSIAIGNPCRVIREVNDEDKKFYFKDREFIKDEN